MAVMNVTSETPLTFYDLLRVKSLRAQLVRADGVPASVRDALLELRAVELLAVMVELHEMFESAWALPQREGE